MDAHADAVARAKAIAARLAGRSAAPDYSSAAAPASNGGADVQSMLDMALGGGGGGGLTMPSINTNGGALAAPPDMSQKRGVEEALASLIPGLGTIAAKRQRTDGAGDDNDNDAVKKIWIPSDRNPGYNYVGLLIGPGGSKQRELIASSGGNVRISIRGKGSNSKSGGDDIVPGMPEEPLHVLLEGNKDSVERAERLVRELLENSEAADLEKAKQLGSMKDPDGAVAPGGYTPKPVAQILGQTGAIGQYGPPADAESTLEEKIGIPNGVVGFVIGRGGESIASMQRRTGCRVQIQKEHEMAPGTNMRVITLTAAEATQISECRAIIEAMVRERMMANQAAPAAIGLGAVGAGPGYNAASQMAQLQKALAEGQAHVTIQVPDADVGLIIGKGGAQIRNIQEKSGANVQIPQVADANNPLVRTVNISHPNREGGEFAKQMIEEVLATKLANNNGGMMGGGMGIMGGGGGGGGMGEVTIQVNCPDKDVGMIIGRGGCVIKQMQTTTRCRVQIPPTPAPGSIYRVISVTGSADGTAQVKQMIETIIAEQSSQSVMSGAAFTNGNQYGQQQQNYYGGQQQVYGQQVYGQQAYGQQYGQPVYGGQMQTAAKSDYSAEWAAYYAAQAEAGQGGGMATASAPAAAPAAATAPEQQPYDAYYEVFWQYAAYYGEEAARTHYGAWSPPVGTLNPNAATAAPTTTPALVAPANAPIAAAATEAQDSSVRKVSNLPAWMTKQ